jgi:hypothetical protein
VLLGAALGVTSYFGMVAGAAAGPIQFWDFEIRLGFTSFTDTAGGVNEGSQITASGAIDPISRLFSNPADLLPLILSWGTPSNLSGLNPDLKQSAIGVDPNDTTGTLLLNGPEGAATSEIYHENNVVRREDLAGAKPYLRFATLETELLLLPQLTPEQIAMLPPGFVPSIRALAFDINFIETPNTAGSCPTPSVVACDDIFVITSASLSGGAISETFTFLGFTYKTFLEVDDLGVLSDAACLAAGVASGCTGLITDEGGVRKSFGVRLRIELVEVSEPGVLALFGAGLLLLGYKRRKLATAAA